MEFPFLIENRVFEDSRGVFAPLQLNYDNSDNLELKKNWLQSNVSRVIKEMTWKQQFNGL